MRFVPSPTLLDSPRGRRLSGAGPREAPATRSIPTACRVAVVGGGPAAVALAANLYHRWGDLDDVVVLDAHGTLLGRFLDRVDTLAQRVLRSPYEHHVGTHEHRDCELLDFARCRWDRLTDVERQEIRMAMSGQRSVVPLDVFQAYAEHVVRDHGIGARCWQATVHAVTRHGTGWTVRHDGGELSAERVVLAPGEDAVAVPERWPAGDQVRRWDRYSRDQADETVLVSGSGLSAAHVIAERCSAGCRVVWVQRASERFQCADVDVRFFRPEGRAAFRALPCERRLRILARHRTPSIMFEFRPLLRQWERSGLVEAHRNTLVTDVRELPDGRLAVALSSGTVVVDRVIAAHGTTPAALPVTGLPLVGGGLPVLDDRTLSPEGAPGLHVTGAHASLSIGPAARNIDGMRIAAGLVAAALERPGAGL